MNTESGEIQTVRELASWFQERLDESNVHWEDAPLSYDGNSPYDILFYRLQTEAARYWQDHYGFIPTPGQLTKGFFDAEFERSRRQRLAKRTWRQKLQAWFTPA